MCNTLLIKQSCFNVWSDKNDSQQLHVEVKGLGMVSINRTDGEVIIDVFDKSESNGSLNSLVFENSDFSEGFTNDLQREIEKYDPSIELDAQECLEAYKYDVKPHKFIENYFKLNSFTMAVLKPLKGECKPYTEQVKELMAPYIKITDEQHTQLESIGCDFFMTKGGMVVTFGSANGGYALMPLQEAAAEDVIAKQSLLNAIIHNGELSQVHVKAIEKAGWQLWQQCNEYSDLELDVTYQTQEENNIERYSLNIHLTIRWEDKSVYMLLGTNLGDGFNSHHQVNYDNRPLEDALESYLEQLFNAFEMGAEEDEYLALVTKYPDAWKKITDGVAKLTECLGIEDKSV